MDDKDLDFVSAGNFVATNFDSNEYARFAVHSLHDPDDGFTIVEDIADNIFICVSSLCCVSLLLWQVSYSQFIDNSVSLKYPLPLFISESTSVGFNLIIIIVIIIILEDDNNDDNMNVE